MMITQKIAVIGKKTDQNVLGIWPRFDRINDPAEAMIKVTDLAVVSRLHNPRQSWIDRIRPNGISHEGNVSIQVVFLDAAENQLRHSIRIVHSIEGNWWSQWWMRAHERDESEKRARIRFRNLFYRAIGYPPLGTQLGRQRTALWKVIHFAAFPHWLLQKIEFRMLASVP